MTNTNTENEQARLFDPVFFAGDNNMPGCAECGNTMRIPLSNAEPDDYEMKVSYAWERIVHDRNSHEMTLVHRRCWTAYFQRYTYQLRMSRRTADETW